MTSPEPRRILAVVPLIPDQRYYGEDPARLRRGWRGGLVRDWRKRRPEAVLFRLPSWVRMGH
jgi:hypothetical protein